jgi:hypothetical protein
MKKIFLLTLVLFVVCHLAGSPNVYAQKKTDEITAEETKAANELADRFVQRLDETGDIGAVVSELFVPDYMERHVREQKLELSEVAESPKRNNLRFVPWIDYSPSLLEQVPALDWRELYVSVFNFSQYGITSGLNLYSKEILAGKDFDPDPNDVKKIYPKKVRDLLDQDPIVSNLIVRKNTSNIIATVDDFRRVTKILKQADEILRNPKPLRMNADAVKVQQTFSGKVRAELGPTLIVDEKGRFGFPARTRMFQVWASVWVSLTVTKVGNDYKIIEAFVSSPD